MVSVSEEDRDVLRFLWVDDIAEPDPEVQVFRFARVVFGVSSSSFLNATIDYHLRQFASTHPELVELLSHSFYVDDVVSGAADEDAALKLYRESKEIMRAGGFNLRKFTTNVLPLQGAINELEESPLSPAATGSDSLNETTYTKSTLGGAQPVGPTDQKVLGVRWDVATDLLVFSVQEMAAVADVDKPTKRLSLIHI